ncbi:MAG: hypothetical protein ACR2QM_14030, partial [Longimicrobiales bacterium]
MKASATQQDPSFLVFLPILCALWADGLLEEGELRIVHRTLDKADWLTQEGRAEIHAWLDVDAPPDPSVFESAKARVQEGSNRDGRTLTQVGLNLATAAGSGDGPWANPAALATLGALESELGLAGPE